MVPIKKRDNAFDLLISYHGNNPYLLFLKEEIFEKKKTEAMGDFQVEYIIRNHDFTPTQINKITRVSDWYAKKKREDWNLKFTPKKILIGWFLGETETTFHCYVKFKQNQEKATQVFIPKKALLENVFVGAYENMEIDFDKYDMVGAKHNPPIILKEHQKTGVKFLLERKKCILADDMGLGKTITTTIATIEGGFNKILIICPASLKTTWKRELGFYVDESDIGIVESIINKTKPELEEFLNYEVGTSKKKRDELLVEAKERGKWCYDKRYVIVNYDILNEFYVKPKSRSKQDIETALNNSPMLTNKFDLVILDEAHKLSNSTSGRYKLIEDFLKRGEHDSLFCITGTPITNRPMNYYNLLRLIGADITKDWNYYVDRYCKAFQIPAKGEKEKYTNLFLKRVGVGNWYHLSEKQKDDLKSYIRTNARMIRITSGASNLEELKDRTKHLYIRRLKSEVGNIVDKTVKEVYYDLTTNQKREYDNLWNEYEEAQVLIGKDVEDLNKDLIEGAILRQYIAKSMVPHTIKLVEQHIEDEEKVIIACCYDEEVYSLQEYFGDKCVVYNGKMTPKQKDKAEKDFMNDPKKMVFIGQIIAAGVGLTLTSANIAIFNSYDYVPSNNSQFGDRVHRISQNKDVIFYFQMFNNTISEDMWAKVVRKEMIINKVIKTEDEK